MATDTYPIAHPTEPGLYEAAGYPLSADFWPIRVFEDGRAAEVPLPPRDERTWIIENFASYAKDVGPFRRIDADGKPLPTAPHVIGLVGKKRTGKDTTARALVEHGYTPIAFADPLRDMALAIDPVVGWQEAPASSWEPRGMPTPIYYSDALRLYGYEKAKEHFPEFRRFLQRLGTEGVRDVLGKQYGLRDLIGDDLWIVLAEQRIQAAETPLVFTDVRFPNEAELIEKYGETVRIVRPMLAPSTDDHPSETALDHYSTTYVLTNDSTRDGLASAVDDMVTALKP
ncbi:MULTISPECIES: hypothetical protein [unclassified Microbacterium]|uniref:hypothetical protein n=1 Tax=unclassified Microbacterium TaxID=2609290 RepID=UPI00301646E8